jgi:hypothetical protein
MVLFGPGCGDENGDENDRPNPAALITLASDLSVATSLALQAETLGEIGLPPAAPRFAPADTLLPGEITCPLVGTTSDSLARFLTLDFADGCVSDLDGLTASGAVVFTVTDNALGNGTRLSAEFQGYARQGRRTEGGLEAEERGQFLDISMSLLVLTGGSMGGILSGDLVAKRLSDPTGPAYCRDWMIDEGSGSMTISGFNYTFDVLDTLVVPTCCGFPVEGALAVTGAGLIPAFFDFGDGTCDSLATLTISGDRQTIALGYAL